MLYTLFFLLCGFGHISKNKNINLSAYLQVFKQAMFIYFFSLTSYLGKSNYFLGKSQSFFACILANQSIAFYQN